MSCDKGNSNPKQCIHNNNYYCTDDKCRTRHNYDKKINKCLINKLLYKVNIDIEEYNEFHQGLLNNLNYNNLIIAGGSLSKLYLNTNKKSSLYKASDIDIYLYGTEKEKMNKLKYLLKFFKYTILIPYNNVYTMYFRGKTRMIQIICGGFKNKYSIIKDFDYSHVQILYDGNNFLTTYKFLENIYKNKTEYNYQYNINIFRIYKTLLLGLDIINYQQPYQIDDKKYSKEIFFQVILNNESFKEELDNIYYPSKYESFDNIKEELYKIYGKKYKINKYSFYNIVNNLNLINTIEWNNTFKEVIMSSYGTQVDYKCMISLLDRLTSISQNNYKCELKKIKKLMKDDTTYFKKEYYYRRRIFLIIRSIIIYRNISFIYQILTIFKNIISHIKHPEKIQIILLSYSTGNKDIIKLLHVYFNINLTEILSNKNNKEKLYINLLKSGNITLFEEINKKIEHYYILLDKYIISMPDILLYSYESNNLEFIKYIYKKFDMNKFLSEDTLNIICYNRFLLIVSYINNLEVFKYLMEYNDIDHNYFNSGYVINDLIKRKNSDIVNYILEKVELPNISNIFGFLCYFGNMELVESLLTTHSIHNPTYDCYNPDLIELNKYNYGAFRHACKSGNLELVKLLLKLEPNTDIEAYNNCAIKFACLKGHLNIIKYLLFIKPKINLFENTSTKYGNGKCKCYNTDCNNATHLYKCNIFCYALDGGHLNVISYFISLSPSKIKYFENNLYYKNQKIRFIQNKMKELLLDPRTKYGKKRLEREYQKLIE